MKALIIGATGATGTDLVQTLLQDPFYEEVVIFVRRASGMAHAKLKEVMTDFKNLETVSGEIQGDVLFSCLGTTLKAAGSKEKQWQIDYDIPLKFATMARQQGVHHMVLLSSYGASAGSRVFYSQMKGKLEDALSALAFECYVIFRPGLLLRKDTDRMGEKLSATLIHFLNNLGMIRKYKPMPTATLAEKLARSPRVFMKGDHVIELDAIFSF